MSRGGNGGEYPGAKWGISPGVFDKIKDQEVNVAAEKDDCDGRP